MKRVLKELIKWSPVIMIADLGFGIGPINLIISISNLIKIKKFENDCNRVLKEGETASFVKKEGTEGYVYIKRDNILVKSKFNKHIQKPYWAFKSEDE